MKLPARHTQALDPVGPNTAGLLLILPSPAVLNDKTVLVGVVAFITRTGALPVGFLIVSALTDELLMLAVVSTPVRN